MRRLVINWRKRLWLEMDRQRSGSWSLAFSESKTIDSYNWLLLSSLVEYQAFSTWILKRTNVFFIEGVLTECGWYSLLNENTNDSNRMVENEHTELNASHFLRDNIVVWLISKGLSLVFVWWVLMKCMFDRGRQQKQRHQCVVNSRVCSL